MRQNKYKLKLKKRSDANMLFTQTVMVGEHTDILKKLINGLQYYQKR